MRADLSSVDSIGSDYSDDLNDDQDDLNDNTWAILGLILWTLAAVASLWRLFVTIRQFLSLNERMGFTKGSKTKLLQQVFCHFCERHRHSSQHLLNNHTAEVSIVLEFPTSGIVPFTSFRHSQLYIHSSL